VAHLIEPVLDAVLPENLAQGGAHGVAIAAGFALVTMLHIVLGELAPSRLRCSARRRPR